eukprot:XP_006505034.1 PREDICTED: BET1 homolog isoform X1 [Mus musculus]
MRRAGLGDGAPPGSYGNYGYANTGYNACEEENDRLTESLRSKVTAIKSQILPSQKSLDSSVTALWIYCSLYMFFREWPVLQSFSPTHPECIWVYGQTNESSLLYSAYHCGPIPFF